jgi:RimJ/RimL family protein N-acetyltransferase
MPNGLEPSAITTERLQLEPLRVDHADELAAVLDDAILHEFVGGAPATLPELRQRYERLVAGSSDPGEVRLNWVARRRADPQPVGTMQATVAVVGGRVTAWVAWVVGVEWQGQGFASEAARALVDWLTGRGVDEVVAHVHPDHRASEVVAARAGLRLTTELADGERVWRAAFDQRGAGGSLAPWTTRVGGTCSAVIWSRAASSP